MVKLFSYVVHHDLGFAPHPTSRYCTLAWCKYKTMRRNIVELAKVGDWVVGTGGADLRTSAGHGKLIYAMRVDEKLRLAQYCDDKRFAGRFDAEPDPSKKDRYTLVSRHFFYFGRNAVRIPSRFLKYPLEKKGPAFRRDFDEDFISDFVAWLDGAFKVGLSGSPCKPDPDLRTSECPSKVRRKGCA